MTTTLGSFGILVEDRANKRMMDFYASPISRAKLVGGYISSALCIGFMMCTFTFAVSNLFLFFSGEALLALDKTILLMGDILLAVISSGSMVLLIVSFFKTTNAFAAASTVVGTLLGFLAGIYIPIGTLPDYLQTIVKLFPVSHSASLFRQILIDNSIIEAFANTPIGIKEDFLSEMGVIYEISGREIAKLGSVFYLLETTTLFFTLSLLVMNRKRK